MNPCKRCSVTGLPPQEVNAKQCSNCKSTTCPIIIGFSTIPPNLNKEECKYCGNTNCLIRDRLKKEDPSFKRQTFLNDFLSNFSIINLMLIIGTVMFIIGLALLVLFDIKKFIIVKLILSIIGIVCFAISFFDRKKNREEYFYDFSFYFITMISLELILALISIITYFI